MDITNCGMFTGKDDDGLGTSINNGGTLEDMSAAVGKPKGGGHLRRT